MIDGSEIAALFGAGSGGDGKTPWWVFVLLVAAIIGLVALATYLER